MLATTALGYLVAWGPFAVLCIWEMITKPKVSFVLKLAFPTTTCHFATATSQIWPFLKGYFLLPHHIKRFPLFLTKFFNPQAGFCKY